MTISLPAGVYSGVWVNIETGAITRPESFRHGGGDRILHSPESVTESPYGLSGRRAEVQRYINAVGRRTHGLPFSIDTASMSFTYAVACVSK